MRETETESEGEREKSIPFWLYGCIIVYFLFSCYKVDAKLASSIRLGKWNSEYFEGTL